MAVLTNTMMQGTAAISDEAGDYQIEKSLRFNRSDNPSLVQVPSSSGNTRVWTWSGWVKRAGLGTEQDIFGCVDPDSTGIRTAFRFEDTDKLAYGTYSSSSWQHWSQTTALFRDTGAWYHIVLACDTTQAIASERTKLYVNGKRVTMSNDPAQNLVTYASYAGVDRKIGDYGSSSNELDGYLADVHFIDGLQLSPAAFGSFDSTGVWNPKEFALPTPNTNKTWSGMLTCAAGFSTGIRAKEYAMNGNVSPDDFASSASNNKGKTNAIVFTPTGGLVVNNSIEIYGRDATTQTMECEVDMGNGYLPAVSGTSGSWITVFEGSGTLTKLQVWHSAGNSGENELAGVRVDGVILADGKTDPTTRNNLNDGRNWTTWGTETGTAGSNNHKADKLFNGTNSQMYAAANNSVTWTAPGSGISYTTLRIFIDQDNDLTSGFLINGTDYTNNLDDTSYPGKWYDVGSWLSGANLTSITAATASGGSPYAAVTMIEVDGHILLDDTTDNSFHLKFNDTAANRNLGYSQVMKTPTGAQPMYGPGADDSAKADIKLAIPGYDLVDHSHTIKGSGSAQTLTNTNTTNVEQGGLYNKQLYFNDNAKLVTAVSTDYELGTSDFTVECWINGISNTGTDSWLCFTDGEDTYSGIPFLYNASNDSNPIVGCYFSSNGSSWDIVAEDFGSQPCGIWTHFAVVRNGNTFKGYRNGVEQFSVTSSASIYQQHNQICIGHGQAGNFSKGYMQDIRYYKGTAKYTANFIPPTRNDFTVNNLTETDGIVTKANADSKPILGTSDDFGKTYSSGYETDSNSSSLVLAISGRTLADNHADIKGSGTNHSISNSSSTTSTDRSKFYGTAIKTDGGSQHFVVADSSDFEFGSGEFTIECWINAEDVDGDGLAAWLMKGTNDSNNSFDWRFYASGDGSNENIYCDFMTSDGAKYMGENVNNMPNDEWVHFAVVRDNTDNKFYLYKNGVKFDDAAVASGATVDDDYSDGLTWGYFNAISGGNHYGFNGWVNDIRIYKGFCKYPGGTTFDIVTEGTPDELDSLTDTPTNYGTDAQAGGEVRGNYCTLNPLRAGSSADISQGNLTLTGWGGSGYRSVFATMGMTSSGGGKWYYEATSEGGGDEVFIGMGLTTNNTCLETYAGQSGQDTWGMQSGYASKRGPSGGAGSYGSHWKVAGDVIGVAVDLSPGGTSGTITLYKNGSSMGTMFSDLDCTKTYVPLCFTDAAATSIITLNFGQRAFKHAAPAGYKCLCTQNLDDTFSGDELNNPSKYFDVLTYTGTGSSNALKGLNFGPDLVWIKKRSGSSDHALFDRVRGVHERLYPNDSSGDDTLTNTLTAFGTEGFTLGDMADVNADGDTYVSWNWDAGTAVTNYTTSDNSADIASTVWKNQTSGLSIVKWESDGASAIKTVNHGLNAAPEFVITKKYSGSGGWVTFHTSFSNQVRDILELNTNGAVATESNDIWSRSNTLLGYRQSNSATDGDDMIAYCWTSIPGYSAFGKYTGNGNANGPFIYTGFKPRWFLMKELDDATNWLVYDSERNVSNPTSFYLLPNTSAGGNTYEASSTNIPVDFLSNGFKLKNDNSGTNASGDTYIYAAFAEHPFKLTRAA